MQVLVDALIIEGYYDGLLDGYIHLEKLGWFKVTATKFSQYEPKRWALYAVPTELCSGLKPPESYLDLNPSHFPTEFIIDCEWMKEVIDQGHFSFEVRKPPHCGKKVRLYPLS